MFFVSNINLSVKTSFYKDRFKNILNFSVSKIHLMRKKIQAWHRKIIKRYEYITLPLDKTLLLGQQLAK